jgi:hypothetical protein
VIFFLSLKPRTENSGKKILDLNETLKNKGDYNTRKVKIQGRRNFIMLVLDLSRQFAMFYTLVLHLLIIFFLKQIIRN